MDEATPKLPEVEPSSTNGEPTEPLRNAAVCSCGAGLHATDPYRCARGHAIGGNPLARKHPVNINRRDQLLAEIVAEYKPTTVIDRSNCADLAATLERLDDMKVDSTQRHRLIDDKQKLAAALEASRPRETNAITEIRRVIVDQHGNIGDALDAQAARLTAMARYLRRAEEFEKEPREAVVPTPAQPPPTLAPAPAPPALPPPTCPYCRRSLARCAELKETRLDVWRCFHYFDPVLVKERDDLATKEMMQQLGKPLPDWFR